MMRFDPLLSGGQSVESQATSNAPPQHGQRGQQQRQVDLFGNASRTVQYLAYRDGQQDERLEEGEEDEEQRPHQQHRSSRMSSKSCGKSVEAAIIEDAGGEEPAGAVAAPDGGA
jgi:hypothetical protein